MQHKDEQEHSKSTKSTEGNDYADCTDYNDTNTRRLTPRRGPAAPNGHSPSLGDIYALLGAMQRQLDTIESRQASHIRAFTKNDLGEPDYDGHRAYHTRSNKANENLEKYKTSLTKSLLEWIMKGGIVLMGAGVLSLIGNRLGDLIK